MARSEARIYTEIWEDSQFLALNRDAQGMFLFLLSQKDLAHDGVLALRERRWSRGAADLTADSVVADLEALAAARFIVIDEDAGELLIRSFIRRDKVYRQPNVLRAARDHLELVQSPGILAEIRTELLRVLELDGLPKDSPEVIADMLATIGKRIGNPSPDPSPDGSREGTAEGCELRPGERGVVTAVTTDSPFPVPRAVPPPAADAPAAASGAPPNQSVTQRSKRITDAYADEQPMCRWPAINGIVIKAIKTGRWADDEIRDALLRLAKEGRTVTVESLRVELDGLPPGRASPGSTLAVVGQPRPSTTDQRVNAALAIADQFRERSA